MPSADQQTNLQLTYYGSPSFSGLHPNGHIACPTAQLYSTLSPSPGKFKKKVGCSLRIYIQQAKIDEARSLLLLTDNSISEISTLLNYHDQSYFFKYIKKFTGVTPNEYRNNR
ncbi:helix-turn-helix domain-containing protein [Paenibacillus lentus]|uniref:AraC family transcriptional regulator n=1 Tax=Paenibacillus lentus TaxID=1338368 RepID=A0A3S8RXE6_9BACL|nr:helix-turn-helix transcriptional regulator [Paenibacillus lentus]AZK47658.1 AraC family transcriptional regulator [Paenibacillus lentus]